MPEGQIGLEMRRYERFPCPYLAQVRFGDDWEECGVVDMSGGGARLATTLAPKVGQEVKLHVDSVAEVMGRVVRHTEDGFAMQFDLTELWVH